MNSSVLLMTSVGTSSGTTTALTLQGLKKLVALYNEPEGRSNPPLLTKRKVNQNDDSKLQVKESDEGEYR